MKNVRYIASVSFGKDSLAMLLLILEKGLPLDEVVFYNTGMEFQAIYDIRDKVITVLNARGIKFTEIHPARPFLYDMLERPVVSEKKQAHNGYGWCGGMCRWGTTEKIAAIDRHTKDCHVYVGIAVDEKDRLGRLPEWKSSPIADAGMSEADCLVYCRERGFIWEENGVDLYSILDRVSCWCCCNKNRKELKNIYRYLPGYWEKLKDLQRQLDRPMKNFRDWENYGEYGNLFAMEAVFRNEIDEETRLAKENETTQEVRKKDKPMGQTDLKIPLYPHQERAIEKMKNGCILVGGVGSGKSRTGLAYYFKQNGGSLDPYKPMKKPKDLYIITTAQKRDKYEWEDELLVYSMSTDKRLHPYSNNVIVDSWNNISKYKNVAGAFFLLDEQRVCGYGAWVKAFLKIAKANNWILLSATPGDTWSDYIPVFIANGFYRTKGEFTNEHVVWNRFAKYPKIDRYIGTGKLLRLRNSILVDMDFERKTKAHHEDVFTQYDISAYKDLFKNRWNPYRDAPIKTASELCYTLRKVVNSDESRQVALLKILEDHPKAIVFYNFDYELDILKNLAYSEGVQIAEYNGHQHDPLPEGDKWVYLVNYAAGNAGWNCITTDTIIFFSQNYSYKVMEQSSGRIDRLNTPYTDLYYYHLRSRSGIDLAINKSLSAKKKFNERTWVKW